MRLIITPEGSSIDIFESDHLRFLVAHEDITVGMSWDDAPIVGYHRHSVYRPLPVEHLPGQERRLYTWDEWMGVAYACWANESMRRNMYYDLVPDVNHWPKGLHRSWEADLAHNRPVMVY